MTHRYGRHGKNAWLRWRERRLRRTSLALAPQIAVLHVPVEFLSRIRKVTILMSDGTEETFQIPKNPLSSPVVEGSTTEKRLNGSGQVENPKDKFYAFAKDSARDLAKRVFKSDVDPYKAKPDVQDTRRLVQTILYGDDHLRQQLDLSEAQENFLRELKAEFYRYLQELSTEHEAPTREKQQLLVFARNDKVADQGNPPEYEQDRKYIRAYISLFSNTPLCQKDVSEDIINNLRERMDLYQRFYEEFEPAKEED